MMRAWIALLPIAVACSGSTTTDTGPVVPITFGATLGPVNRRLLGNNVQWSDQGENLTDTKGVILPDRAAALRSAGTSVLRYPGGTLADAFRFTDSIAPLASRPSGLDLAGVARPLTIGTGEFMDLCKAIGCEPLMTLNLYSGTVPEAVAWVEWVNQHEGPKRSWPKAAYWEVGNEPYLTTATPGYGSDTLTPALFAQRANQTLKALRAVDPTLRLVLPLRSESMNGLATVTKPGFEDTVLEQVTEPFDLVAVHSAYLPIDLSGRSAPADLYLSAMAGPLAFSEALDAHRAKLDRWKPGNDVRFAVTEYHPWLTLETLSVLRTPGFTTEQLLAAVAKDHQANSIAGALYTADLLRVMAYRRDVELAAFWSVAGNYVFGALSTNGVPRPPLLALTAVSEVLRGEQLEAMCTPATFSTPSVGFVRAFAAVPAITVLAAREGKTLRLLLTNKHPSMPIRVSLPGVELGAATVRILTAEDPLFSDDTRAWATWQLATFSEGTLEVPAHSLVRIDAPQS